MYSEEEAEFCNRQKALVLVKLKELDIPFELVEHPRVFTVEEANKHTGALPGVHSKNLFLKSKKNAFFLCVFPSSFPVDLKRVSESLGLSSSSVRFAPPQMLREMLGVLPGSVGPLSLLFAQREAVTVAVAKEMMAEEGEKKLWFHPGSNDATVSISPKDFRKFVESLKFEIREI